MKHCLKTVEYTVTPISLWRFRKRLLFNGWYAFGWRLPRSLSCLSVHLLDLLQAGLVDLIPVILENERENEKDQHAFQAAVLVLWGGQVLSTWEQLPHIDFIWCFLESEIHSAI